MYNKIEIILSDGNVLDVKTEIGFPLTYQIDDIRNPNTSNASFSKTIKLPGTKNNNIRFGGLFDINTDFTYFNPNIKTDARIYVNGTIVMDGYFQLTNINKINTTDLQGNEIEYDIVFFENTVDIFSKIKDQFLTENIDSTNDLDFSAYDHPLSSQKLYDTWRINRWGNAYQYPMMMPIFDTNNGLAYDLSHFKPSIYHKKYLTKIIEDAGYEIGGDFYDNNLSYEKEIIPYNGKDFENDEAALALKEFRTSYLGYSAYATQNMQPGADNIGLNYLSRFKDDSTGANFDNDNNWDTTSQIWQVNSAGVFDLDVNMNFTLTATAIDSVQCWVVDKLTTTNYVGNFSYKNIQQIAQSVPPRKARIEAQLYINTGDSGTQPHGSPIVSDWYDLYPSNDNGFYSGNSYQSSITIPFEHNLLKNYHLYTGDLVSVRWIVIPSEKTTYPYYVSSIQNEPGEPYTYKNEERTISIDLSVTTSSYMLNKSIQNVQMPGETVELNKFIPKNVKKEDILSDAMKRYNLFLSIDPSNNKKLLLRTRDNFYATGQTLDWTDKKDNNTKDSIRLLSDLQDNEILFTYKQDKDDANKNYKLSTGDIYGQKTIEFTNEFQSGTKKVESIFSPTPLVYSDLNNSCILPFIDSLEPDNNIRILYWGGMKSLLPGAINNEWKLYESRDYTPIRYYPYAGHFNDPINPTIDLNFGLNSFYYYDEVTATSNNLYSTYWTNHINFIANGKMLISKFYLTEVDIAAVKNDLNTKIFIKDSYYYINKIKDYNPTINGLTEVELLKIKDE